MSLLKKLGFGKKTAEEWVCSPFVGELVPLEQVKDETFASKVLGDGIAVIPEEDTIHAPVDGTVEMVFDTAHAIAFKTASGAEILMHMGLDTVELNGKFFALQVEAGQQVKAGDVIGTADFAEIRKAGYETVTPILLTNTDEYDELKPAAGKVQAGTKVFALIRK